MPTENRSSNTETKIQDPEGRRERFLKWVLATKHPVLGYLDGTWLARGDDREGYADKYVQGLWVAFKEFAQPAPHTHADPAEVERLTWEQIVALVNEVLGCEAHKWPVHDVGHQMTGINFNSLARIIDRVQRPRPAHADTAEVERLRAESQQLREVIKHSDAQIMRQSLRISNQRAQLAQAQALLEDWHTANCTGEVNVSDKSYRIVTRTAAMLSGNADLNTPVDRDDRSDIVADAAFRDGVMHGYKLAMEGDEAEYQACINNLTRHLHTARAALSASAEPSAPVEIDERAAYDAWRHSDSGYVRHFDRHEWAAWQARAAMERKP